MQMAYNDFFADINNCLGASPMGVMKHTIPGAGAGPIIIYAVGAIQVSVTFFDAMVLAASAVGGDTLQVATSIAPAGYVAMTNAMPATPVNTPSRATTIDPAQSVVGPADGVEIIKAAATSAGIVFLSFFLT